jgi:hypothetical protein
MKTLKVKYNKAITLHKTKTITLPLAIDFPIPSKTLVEDEIIMPFEKIKSKGDAIIYCFQYMDANMLEDILEDDSTYDDQSKWHYIENLKRNFQVFSDAGDTYFKCFKGSCNGRSCSKKQTTLGFDFVGNNSKITYTLIVDIVDGKVLDLYECHSGWMKDLKS